METPLFPVDFDVKGHPYISILPMVSDLVQPLTTGYAALLVPHPRRKIHAYVETPLKLGCITLEYFLGDQPNLIQVIQNTGFWAWTQAGYLSSIHL